MRREQYRILSEYYLETNQQELYSQMKQKEAEWNQLLEKSTKEMSKLQGDDQWESHDLSEDRLINLTTKFSWVREIDQVYIALKRSKHIPDRMEYVIGFLVTEQFDAEREASLIQIIEQNMPRYPSGAVFLLNTEDELANKMTQIPNSLIFERE